MGQWLWCSALIMAVLAGAAALEPAAARQPEGTLTVAVATFGNERWLPHLYPGAEDVVLKPMMENLLHRDLKTGELTPLLAERWEVLEGGKAWRFYLRKGVRFHNGQEMTAEDIKFTLATIAKEGSANSLAPEFRLIQSLSIEDPYTITIRFAKPFVAFGNKVTQGLFGSAAFIESREMPGVMPLPRSPRPQGPCPDTSA
jgi:ABC-type transport system substrate-binding protein